MKKFYAAVIVCAISATSLTAGGPVEIQEEDEPMVVVRKPASSELGTRAKASKKKIVSDRPTPKALVGGGGAGKATFKEFTLRNSTTETASE